MINIDMPDDVRPYVLVYQAKRKGEKGRGQYSQQDAIFAIVREHRELVDENESLRKQIDELRRQLEELKKT